MRRLCHNLCYFLEWFQIMTRNMEEFNGSGEVPYPTPRSWIQNRTPSQIILDIILVGLYSRYLNPMTTHILLRIICCKFANLCYYCWLTSFKHMLLQINRICKMETQHCTTFILCYQKFELQSSQKGMVSFVCTERLWFIVLTQWIL